MAFQRHTDNDTHSTGARTMTETTKAHVPTASPAPTTVKPGGQVALSDAVVGKRQPPEPSSETLGLQGGAQVIAVGRGNLRNLQRGDTLEITVHALVVEDGNRDKVGKDDTVSDTVRKVLAKIITFDEVVVTSSADVDSEPVAKQPADLKNPTPCHRCDGDGVHAKDTCTLCLGSGVIEGEEPEVKRAVEAKGATSIEPAKLKVVAKSTAEDSNVVDLFGVKPAAPMELTTTPAPDPKVAEPKGDGLDPDDETTFTEANLSSAKVKKHDLRPILAKLTGGVHIPESVTKPKLIDGILKIMVAKGGGAPAPAAPPVELTDPPTTSAAIDAASNPDPDVEIEGVDVMTEPVDFVQETTIAGEDVTIAAGTGEVIGSRPAPEGEGSGMTVEEANAVPSENLPTMDFDDLVSIAVALGIEEQSARAFEKGGLVAVIERERVPF